MPSIADKVHCLITNESITPESLRPTYLLDPDLLSREQEDKFRKLWGEDFDIHNNWNAFYRMHALHASFPFKTYTK